MLRFAQSEIASSGTTKSGRLRELAPKRLERLREILRIDHVVSVEELSARLAVSSATVRRDLEQLESLGEVRRVHGGAVGTESRLEEPLFDDKTSLAAREKQRIAQAALKFIQPNDTIFLDGGSTVLELARLCGSARTSPWSPIRCAPPLNSRRRDRA